MHLFCLSFQSYDDEGAGPYVGSFPKGFGYGPEDSEPETTAASPEEQPRILLMGLRRSVYFCIIIVSIRKLSDMHFYITFNKKNKTHIQTFSFA